MRHTPLVLGLALLLSFTAGCGEPSEPQFSDVSGVYRMEAPQTPTAIVLGPRSSVAALVREGVLELNPVWRFQIRYTAEDGSSPSGNGTYERTDAGIVLRYYSGQVEVGTLEGDRLTLDTGYGPIVVFLKIGS